MVVLAFARPPAIHYLAPGFVLAVLGRALAAAALTAVRRLRCSSGRSSRCSLGRPSAIGTTRRIEAERFASSVQPTKRVVDGLLGENDVALVPGNWPFEDVALLRPRAALRRAPTPVPVRVPLRNRGRARVCRGERPAAALLHRPGCAKCDGHRDDRPRPVRPLLRSPAARDGPRTGAARPTAVGRSFATTSAPRGLLACRLRPTYSPSGLTYPLSQRRPAREADAAPTARWEAERLQGETIVRGEEAVWGWSSPAGQLRAARRAKFLVEAAGLGPGVRCLELGCGTGEFTARLAAKTRAGRRGVERT